MSLAGNSPPRPDRGAHRAAVLERHSLFRALPSEILLELARKAVSRTYERHSTIFRKGDRGTSLVGVVQGSIKISANAADGREVVFSIAHPGEMFGEIALLDGGPRSADAIAMTDSDVFFVERADLMAALMKQPALFLAVIDVLCARIRKVSEQVEDVLFLNAAERLAKALLRIAVRTGDDPIPRAKITQAEAGQTAGLSREMTNRQLREWHKARLIEVKRGAIVLLRPAELAKIAGDFDAG